MKPIYILCFLIVSGLQVSCKHDGATSGSTETTVADTSGVASTQSTNETSTTDQSSTNGGENATKSTALGSKAAGENKSGDDGGHDYTFLTHQMFRINGAFVSGKDPKDKPYQSQWVDLEPNGSFKWGKSKDLLYSGNWAYNHDSKILSLMPNDKNYKQSEWSVMFNDQMVVWIGTPTFGNNGTQIQLIRTTEFPQ